MKTKFILHGGMTSQDNPHNDAFFTEFSKDLKDGDTVLYIPFAREAEEEQEEVFARDKHAILAHTDKQLQVLKANLEQFKDQLQEADAIFVTGGVTKVLKERLLTCPEFEELIKDKVYAGSSAGANVVAKFHTSGFAEGVQEGLGILPIGIIAHFGNPEFNATEESKEWFPEDIELLTLPECEWKVIEL